MSRKEKKGHAMSVSEKAKLFKEQSFELQEAFNSLRTNIRFVSLDGNIKKILVTSTVPNEGKSSVAINIAKSLAKDGSRVILIDCDLRKPVLHKYLGFYDRGKTGLTTFMCGEAKLNECIIYDEASKLYFLPSGIDVPNPAEMLGSNTFKKLMDYLTEKFDYIICDTPPADVVSDAAVLSAACDGVVFVVRHRYTSREKVSNAVMSLKSVNANILGVVLNEYKRDEKKARRYDYEYNYYKYRKTGKKTE